MKRWKIIFLFAILVTISLGVSACVSESDEVPSLKATPSVVVEQVVPDDEAKVMAFVECMRDEGIQYKDPVVDSEGNVQQPELVEGFTANREELREPYEACFHHIEGLTFGQDRPDLSEQIDEYLELAECLNDKGYEVDEPTEGTLMTWLTDFRVEFDWDDSEATEAFEECTAEEKENR